MVSHSTRATLFWCAIAAQVVGAQIFFWDALPDYRAFTAGAGEVASPEDFAVAGLGIFIMQLAYWPARRLQFQMHFAHRVILGHLLLCVSELSFFFIAALATVAVFDHWKESQFTLWKFILLSAASFAFVCYKRQLAMIGDAMLERKATMPD